MRWTVGTKIGLGFLLALVILAVIGAVAYYGTNRLYDASGWVTHTHRVIEELDALLQSVTDAETKQRGYLLSADPALLTAYKQQADEIDQHLSKIRDFTSDNPRQQARIINVQAAAKLRMTLLGDVLNVKETKGDDAAKQEILSGRGKAAMEDLLKGIAEMRDEEERLLTERSGDSDTIARVTRWTIFMGSTGAIVLLSLVGLLITRNISVPMGQLTELAKRIAEGDLASDVIETHRRDEVGMLSAAFVRMQRSLRQMAEVAVKIAEGDLRVKVTPQSERDMLGNSFASMIQRLRELNTDVVDSVNALTSTSSELSSSTTELASSASQTAAAVSEATTTVEEVRQTAQLSSQKAKAVSETALRAAQNTERGSKATDDAILGINRIQQQMAAIADSMVRLSEQSQSIGQIVATVEDLAAQSNILAVNASIEAAKAGEHGKGFSVVAQEVRSLAEQSKQATGQVRSILGDIKKATSSAVMATEQGNKAVDAAVQKAGDAGQSIQMLSGAATEAAQAATQIAASSQQQLVGVDQVASAMESIKQASVQNVASARQLESSAHMLKDAGAKLRLAVQRYKL